MIPYRTSGNYPICRRCGKDKPTTKFLWDGNHITALVCEECRIEQKEFLEFWRPGGGFVQMIRKSGMPGLQKALAPKKKKPAPPAPILTAAGRELADDLLRRKAGYD